MAKSAFGDQRTAATAMALKFSDGPTDKPR